MTTEDYLIKTVVRNSLITHDVFESLQKDLEKEQNGENSDLSSIAGLLGFGGVKEKAVLLTYLARNIEQSKSSLRKQTHKGLPSLDFTGALRQVVTGKNEDTIREETKHALFINAIAGVSDLSL